MNNIPILKEPTMSKLYKAYKDERTIRIPIGCRPNIVAIEQYKFDNNTVYVVRCPDGDAEYIKWENVEALFEQAGWVAAWHGDDQRPESTVLIWDEELDDVEPITMPPDICMPYSISGKVMLTTSSSNVVWSIT